MSAKKQKKDPLGDEVAYAFVMTTPEQRRAVCEDWRRGGARLCASYAELLGIDPDGLLLAALLQEEHESVCKPNGRPRAGTYAKLLDFANDHPRPKTVENAWISQPKPVDNLWIKPDSVVENQRKNCGEMDELSTILELSTGVVDNF